MFCILVLPVQDHFEEVDTLLQIVSLIAYSSDPHFITTNVPPIVSIDNLTIIIYVVSACCSILANDIQLLKA